jgi:hypothetical protein
VPPVDRLVPRFAAEPPQRELPEGPWAQRLQEEFLAACLRVETEGVRLGDPGDIMWYPDRTWHGHTFVPATAGTSEGLELYGYVSFAEGQDDEPTDFYAVADFTTETADANPDWRIDLTDEVIGTWHGDDDEADMTLVWGRPLIDGAAVVTAELGDLTVDQAPLVAGRFTLIAPDAIHDAQLEVRLYDRGGREIARESLYTETDDEDEEA